MLEQSTKQRAPWEGRVTLGQRIIAVDAANPPEVVVTFADGFVGNFNFQRLLVIGKVFDPLRDPNFFRSAHPGGNGASLEWVTADGDEIDLCADTLRFEAEGLWDPVTKTWTVE